VSFELFSKLFAPTARPQATPARRSPPGIAQPGSYATFRVVQLAGETFKKSLPIDPMRPGSGATCRNPMVVHHESASFLLQKDMASQGIGQQVWKSGPNTAGFDVRRNIVQAFILQK
jgi:hypothetical protein